MLVLAREVLMSYTIPRRCCAGSGWMRLVAIRLLYRTRGLVMVRPEALGGIWSLMGGDGILEMKDGW